MQEKPLDRALRAGRDLIAEGQDATSGVNRARAQVAMSTAVEAARVLRGEQPAPGFEAPPREVPAAVVAAGRLMWQAAREEARAELQVDRDAYVLQVQHSRAERDAALARVHDLQARLAFLEQHPTQEPDALLVEPDPTSTDTAAGEGGSGS